MNLTARPYHLLGITALMALVASLCFSNKTLDIHLHDTYYVVTLPSVFIAASMVFAFTWLIYMIAQKYLASKTLTRIHVMLTILVVIYFLAASFKMQALATTFRNWTLYQQVNQTFSMLLHCW